MKTSNSYARGFSEIYEKTPKAVFAAVAFSLLSNGGEDSDVETTSKFLREWATLNRNGIVPQTPIKTQ